eukprot:253930_1
MSHYDEKKDVYESDDDQYQESIVSGNDGRRKIDVFEPKPDDVYECIGQLDVEYNYNKEHKFRAHAIGTGTVVFINGSEKDKQHKTAVILTCAHNVRLNVIHCTKKHCNTYRLQKKGDRCMVCQDTRGAEQKEIIIKATNIKFLDRSVEWSNYGKTLASYKCTEIYVPNKQYINSSKPKDGFDWAFLAISDINGVYEERLARININLINGIDTFCDHKQQPEYAIFGYPYDKDNKMVGMKSTDTSDTTEFKIIQNDKTKQYYLRQVAIDTMSGQSGSLVWYKNQDTKTINVCGIHSGGSKGTSLYPQPYNIATLVDKDILMKWEHITNNRTLTKNMIEDCKQQEDIHGIIKRVGTKHVDININWNENNNDMIFNVQLKEDNEYLLIDQQHTLTGNDKICTIDGLQEDTVYLLRINCVINEDEKKEVDCCSVVAVMWFKTIAYDDYFSKCGDKIKISSDKKTISNDSSKNSWDTAYGVIEIDCTENGSEYTIYAWTFKINSCYTMSIGIHQSQMECINSKPNKYSVNYYFRYNGDIFIHKNAKYNKTMDAEYTTGDKIQMVLDVKNNSLTYF